MLQDQRQFVQISNYKSETQVSPILKNFILILKSVNLWS
jgi:hypothetical protein